MGQKYFNDMPWYPKKIQTVVQRCGECGRPNNVYTRKLSSTMAKNLIRLYHLGQTADGVNEHYDYDKAKLYFHVRQFDREAARGEFGVLQMWGLVEEKANEDSTKKTSGMWRLTPEGEKFVTLASKIPKYVIIKWGSEHLGFSGPLVSIRECVEYGNRFNYAELMGQTVKEKK